MVADNSPRRIKTSWPFLKGLEQTPAGKINHMSFSSGVELVCMDFISDATSEHGFAINRSPIFFSFTVSGYAGGKVSHSMTRNEEMTGEPGTAAIAYYPDSRSRSKLLEHQHYKVVNIYISPHSLYEKFDQELDQVPRSMHQILKNSVLSSYFQKINMSPHAKMVVDQIFNCPYTGSLKKLYLETKSMELIICQLAETAHAPVEINSLPLQSSERERIHFAKEILLGDMGNPPSLHTLARQTGLNEIKLNRGFKQEFGMTVYKLYQMHRIKQSKEILDEGRLNIDETAQFLGFFDTTHFIKQFKNYFGTTPGAYLKDTLSCL